MIDDDSTATVKVDSVSDDWVGCCISQYSFICNELDIQLGYVGLFFIFLAERPREFLIDQLEQLKLSKVSSSVDSPCLFSNANLEAIFGILDPIDHGYITYSQFKEGEPLKCNISYRLPLHY